MTCAGIASVFIASGRLSAGDAEIGDKGLQCCGPHEKNEAVWQRNEAQRQKEAAVEAARKEREAWAQKEEE